MLFRNAVGACDGVLDRRDISNAPIHLHQSGRADASCLQALAFPPGTGVFTFVNGPHIAYTLDFTSEATELDGTAYGARSGRANGHATFLTQRSSPTITLDCGAQEASVLPDYKPQTRISGTIRSAGNDQMAGVMKRWERAFTDNRIRAIPVQQQCR